MNGGPTEVNTGWRTVLSLGIVYRLVQFVFSEKRSKALILNQCVLPAGDNCHVLDMGCGPGNLLGFLPETVRYTGFDVSEDYIASAQKTYTERADAQFICATSLDSKLRQTLPDQSVDVAIVHGVFHHITDAQAQEMFELARRVVRPGGKMLILEPVWFEGQSVFRRWIMSLDRGKNIKALHDWTAFFETNTAEWADMNLEVHPNLIRFYDLVVCIATVR